MTASTSNWDYSKPPAVEVIYSIRTALQRDVDPRSFLEAVKHDHPDAFSVHKEFKAFEGALTMKSDGSAEHKVNVGLSGFQFITSDGAFFVHHLLQGLTLNFLPPYPGYPECLERLKSHWATHQRVTANAPVAAVTLRYMDRIDIPITGPSMDLDEYFTIAPRSPGGLSAHNCYMQYWLNGTEQDVRARVTWSSLENKPGHWSFLLDTEAILDPASISSDAELWARFDVLHDWCRHIFHNSLTEKCRTLFK